MVTEIQINRKWLSVDKKNKKWLQITKEIKNAISSRTNGKWLLAVKKE